MFFFFAFLAAMAGGYPMGFGGAAVATTSDAAIVRPATTFNGLSHAARTSQDNTSGQPSYTGGNGDGSGGSGSGGTAHKRKAQDNTSGQPS